jgi:hypothetical protein
MKMTCFVNRRHGKRPRACRLAIALESTAVKVAQLLAILILLSPKM